MRTSRVVKKLDALALRAKAGDKDARTDLMKKLDALALRAKAGDKNARTDLMEWLYPRVVGIVQGAMLCNDRDEAKGVAHAFFADKFLKVLDGYEARGTILAFLRKVLRNYVKDYWRTEAGRMRRITHIYEVNPPPESGDISFIDEWPEEQLKAYHERLRAYLFSCLTAEDKEIMYMRYWRGMSFVTIAEELLQTYSYVTVRHHRAKKFLHSHLIRIKDLPRSPD